MENRFSKVVNLAEKDGPIYHLALDDSEQVLFLNPKEEIAIDVTGKNSQVSLLFSENVSSFKLTVNVEKEADIAIYCADFVSNDVTADVDIHLNGKQASCYWRLASLSKDKDKKIHTVSVYHHTGNTYAKVDNYGVCKDQSKLTFSGTSYIEKGSSKSKTYQTAKIMVFDALSNAIAKPILKIDENDVEASHAAVVGKINDDHLFYLTSRGLNESEAKALITFGYLKPILTGFTDEYKTQIEMLIEGRI